MTGVPKEGSRKRQVYDTLQDQGVEQAVKLGAELGLTVGTVRSWLGAWAKGGNTPTKRTRASEPFAVRYTFDTEAAARREAKAKAKNMGADPEIFSVVSDGKRWGIQPRHLDASIVLGVFKKGQRVHDITNHAKVGVIVSTGAEVSEVQWSGGVKQNITNTYLRHADAPAKKKSKRA